MQLNKIYVLLFIYVGASGALRDILQHCKENIFVWPRQAKREWAVNGKDAGQGARVKCALMQMNSTLVTR